MPTYNLTAYGGTGLGYGRSTGYSFTADADNKASVVAQDDDAILNDWSSGNYHGTSTPGIWNGDTSSTAVSSDIPWLTDGEMITSGVWYELSYTHPETGATETTEAFLIWDDTNNYWGGYSNSYVFTTDPLVDGVTYTVTSVDNNAGVPWAALVCFANGTLIETSSGAMAIEQLRKGDLVLTQDHGLQPVRWIGKRRIYGEELASNAKLIPVQIVAGALGNGRPRRDLSVSQQHRIQIQSQISCQTLGHNEVLVPAIKLTEAPGIFVNDTVEEVEYFHILFDQHEIVFAEGTPCESLLLGKEALKAISAEALTEIESIFPALFDPEFDYQPAKYVPDPKEQRSLVAKHVASKKPMSEPSGQYL